MTRGSCQPMVLLKVSQMVFCVFVHSDLTNLPLNQLNIPHVCVAPSQWQWQMNEGLQESFAKHVIILAVLLGGGHT